MSNNLGSYPSNVPDHPQLMSCVYAISGTYGFLPRILFYVTLILAIFGRHREWLIIGALVTAMTYAGTTAVHQMALVSSRVHIYDLDILGAWAVLSSGALAYVAMMHWSSTLRDSHARAIFLVWGVLIGTALIFGRSELFSTALSEPEPACYSDNGELLVYPIELITSAFKCSYKCFSNTKPMRQPSEVMVIPYEALNNQWTDLSVVLMGPIQFVAYAALSLDAMHHNPSRICSWIVLRYLEPKHHARMYRHIHDASAESWYGGYFALIHFARHKRWSTLKVILLTFTIPWFAMGVIVDVLSLPMLVINMVLNELTLMKSELPTNETNYAIGQWGPWVASVLVVLAAVLNQMLIWRDRIERRKKLAKEAVEIGKRDGGNAAMPDATYHAQPELEEQTSGVVKPSLVHVPTLQMEEPRILKR